MTVIKKLSCAAFTLAALCLTACQNLPSNTLSFNPQQPASAFNTNNQRAIVNVITKDGRAQPEIASYTLDSGLFKLFASPDVSKLFQQVFQQNLNSKGFRLSSGTDANTNVFITVKDFYANVDQGNLRYAIHSKIQLEVHIQGIKGNYTKQLGATRTQEGVFSAGNDEIKKTLDLNLKDVINALYKDQDITNAIIQYSN